MRNHGFASKALVLAGMVVVSGMLCAQDFPTRPVRIVTGEPAGGTDLSARLIGQNLSAAWRQAVVVDNKPGAEGAIAAVAVAKSPADGYTMLLWGSGLWVVPLMQDSSSYDPVRDFSPITLALTAPNVLVVNPNLPVQSVKELIALAKAKPGTLNYGSGSSGAAPHLAAELFKNMAGVNILRVPYKGGSTAVKAVVTKEVDMMFASSASAAPLVKAGKLRALAVTSIAPSALAPDLPTVAASGLPGYETASAYGIFAPANTPGAIVNKLHNDIAVVLRKKDVADKFFAIGLEVVASTPQQLADAIKAERSVMGKVIKEAGIKAE